jgi:predicted RNA-binding protein YlqC (UPF0109 family)
MSDQLPGQALIDLIVNGIVEHTEVVDIKVEETESKITYNVYVHPDDMKKMIGKGGRVIKSIKNLTKVVGTPTQRVYCELHELAVD